MAELAPVPTPAPARSDDVAAVAVAIAQALAHPAALQAFLTANRERLVAEGHIHPEALLPNQP